MKSSAPRSNKKSAVQPVIVTNGNKITPKVSERTIRKRKKERQRRLNPGIFSSSLNLCGIVCLYGCLILAILIGAGGIALCVIYFNADVTTQGWKIGGIVLGIITCIIGIILILISIFKQTRNRKWRSKNDEALVSIENDYIDDVDQLNIENNKQHIETRETASSPILNASYEPLKSMHNDLTYCSTCKRLQPYDHQCLFSTPYQSEHASIAIQSEQTVPSHTNIDRSQKHSATIETQTNVSRNPITENIIYKRVPIPTATVTVQQPTTKVMILRVPNTAGELIIQPKATTTTYEK